MTINVTINKSPTVMPLSLKFMVFLIITIILEYIFLISQFLNPNNLNLLTKNKKIIKTFNLNIIPRYTYNVFKFYV